MINQLITCFHEFFSRIFLTKFSSLFFNGLHSAFFDEIISFIDLNLKVLPRGLLNSGFVKTYDEHVIGVKFSKSK